LVAALPLWVIRGPSLPAKLDDLPHHILGATMAMLNVLILGNQQSEATTDVTDSTDIYPCNASTGSRADRPEGIASLNPVGWVLTDRWTATMATLIPRPRTALPARQDHAFCVFFFRTGPIYSVNRPFSP